jgi:hypothetical protein
MKEYHKIPTVFTRDPDNDYKTLLTGEFATPELGFLADNEWVFTEKVDGTNIRVMYDGKTVTFGGRTDRAQIPAKLVDRLKDMFLESVLANYPEIQGEMCLYGEGYGAKIQKGGGNYSPTQEFVLFDVKIDGWWLQRKDVVDIAATLGIGAIPIIGTGTLYQMVEMAKEGFNSHWGDFPAEGIVARPSAELLDRGGRRIITKIKHKDFA